MSEQDVLWRVVKVHCFFPHCPYVAQDSDPDAAHGAMERHYSDVHQHGINRLIRRLNGTPERA